MARRYADEVAAVETERLRLSVLRRSAHNKVTDYIVRNRDWHTEFAQTHDESYYSNAAQKEYMDYL